MNKKTLLAIIIIIILILIGAGAIYWYWQKQSKLPGSETGFGDQTETKTQINEGILQLEDDLEPTGGSAVNTLTDSGLLSQVRYFVERWGTYSNQSDWQNVRDLKPVLTDDFFNQIYSQYQPMDYDNLDENNYEGYEAKFVSVVWEEQTETEARALVTTNRRYLTGDQLETYPQDIRVTLVKQGGSWLVAEAVWQKRN